MRKGRSITRFGRIDLTGVVISNYSDDEFYSLFDSETGMDVKVTIKTYDGKTVNFKVLDIVTNWEEG